MFAEYEIQLSIGGFEDKWVSNPSATPILTYTLDVQPRNVKE